MKEIWKRVLPELTDNYYISNKGNFKILRYRNSDKEFITRGTNSKGYLRVKISFGNCKYKTFLVHRLVAIAFIPNPDNLIEVNHKDLNKKNNEDYNLEWCTHKFNMEHASNNKVLGSGMKGKKGIKHHKSIQISQFTIDGQLIKTYGSYREIERELKYHKNNISLCVKGKQDLAYGYKWEEYSKVAQSQDY